MTNRPVNFSDPTGHMLDNGCKTEGCGEWTPKSDADKRNWAFTKMFKGSGKNSIWIKSDWDFYLDNQTTLWIGKTQWKNPDDETGWDLFALHTRRLASNYSIHQKGQFVRDFALVFAGMSSTKPLTETAWNAQGGHGEYQYLVERNDGLEEKYLDDLHIGENASHHYAGLFFLGYFFGAGAGKVINFGRDGDFWNGEYNDGDLKLGNVAVVDGAYFYEATGFPLQTSPLPLDVADWIDRLSP